MGAYRLALRADLGLVVRIMMRVLMMLKAPRLGQVKTRIARDLGTREALRIYHLLVMHQLKEIPKEWEVEVHHTPREANREMQQWLQPRWQGSQPLTFFPQCPGDLGARMASALESSFARGAGAAVVVGGDCPELTLAILRRAEAALVDNDLAIGPAADGGYTFIGMKRLHAELFRDIAWSTPEVLAATLTRAQALGLRIWMSDTLEDVDDAAGWARFRARIETRTAGTLRAGSRRAAAG